MSVYAKEKAVFFCQAVKSMLNQTVPPADFVMVCDGPLTLELEEAVAAFLRQEPERFKVVRLPQNQGLGAALNAGLPHCRCELVARMDTDDIAVPDRMEKQLALMAAEPDLSVVGGQIAEFQGNCENIIGYRRVPSSSEDINKRLRTKNPMNHVTVLFRKTALLAVGGYQHFPYFADYHLWCRLLADGYRMRNIPDVCCYVRMEEGAYRRRGGWQYFRHTLAMERYLKESGMISGSRFMMNVIVRFVGTVMVPNGVRAFLYKKLLRKGS